MIDYYVISKHRHFKHLVDIVRVTTTSLWLAAVAVLFAFVAAPFSSCHYIYFQPAAMYCCPQLTTMKLFRTEMARTIGWWNSLVPGTSFDSLESPRSMPIIGITMIDPIVANQTEIENKSEWVKIDGRMRRRGIWMLTISLFKIARWLSKSTIRPSFSGLSFCWPYPLFNTDTSTPLKLWGNGGKPGNDNLDRQKNEFN